MSAIATAIVGSAVVGGIMSNSAANTAADASAASDAAAGRAAADQAQVSREQLAFNKQVYEEGKPRQQMIDELGQKVTESQLKSQDQSNALALDYENYMKGTFRPVEKSLVDESMKDPAAEAERLASEAGAGVDQQFGAARDNRAREMAAMGINPNSGRWDASNQSSTDSQAAAKADAMNKARTAGINMSWAKRMDASNLGRNLPSNQATSAGLGITAGNAAVNNAGAGSINARADAGLMNQGYGGAQQGIGNSASTYLNLSRNQSNNAWNQYLAGQNNYQGMMNGISAGYGIYKANQTNPANTMSAQTWSV